jgi:SAM-dependent methyltransferase
MLEERCRLCGGRDLAPVISLGRTPLANSLLRSTDLDQEEPTFPLDVVFCRACALAQLAYSVPPEQLFDQYLYFSSFSDTAVRNAEMLAAEMTRRQRLGPDSLVLEIASNDGYLLKHYQAVGIPVLGIDPAENVARVATDGGIPTLVEYFNTAVGARLAAQGRQADVIHANNVLGHVPELNDFIAGIALALKPDGVLVIEVPHVVELVDRLEFDTIYHEHVSYFSIDTLCTALARQRLDVVDVERIEIHGGSLRVFAAHSGARRPSLRVADLLEVENTRGVNTFEFYAGFAARVRLLRTQLRTLLAELKQTGHRIAGYGASAKGSTLLNYCQIGRETIDFIVDRSTVKQGHYTPGTRILIEAPEALLEKMPDYTLLLTWNFAEEILAQQAEYRSRGGKFLLPLPRPRIV